MPVEKEEFRRALSRFASGVTVVTGRDASGEAFGITVSAFSSVSLDPPLILVCVNKSTPSGRALLEASHFCVNILGESQSALSDNFASGKEDKFEGVRFSDGIGGAPVLDGAAAAIGCSKFREYDGGDHIIFVGQVEKTDVSEESPLVYWRSGYRSLSPD